MTVKEISEKYNVTVDEIRKLCREGKIEGAEKTSAGWSIPEDKAEEYFVGKKEQSAAPAEPKEKIIPSGDEGKKLVTWYSEGDWGEKSYSSYTCTSCNGKGKSTCSSCGGDGKYVYLDFGD